MHDLVKVEPASVRTTPQRASRKRFSPKLLKAINLLETGECTTQKAAAARAGISGQHLSTMLNRPDVRAFLSDRARQTVAGASLRASHRLRELVDASSEHVSLDAAKHVLAIEGIKPAEAVGPTVNIAITPGYVVDLSPGSPVIEGEATRDTLSGGDDA